MDILVNRISKRYGRTQVFRDFSCRFARGSRCAVTAPSGSGKTTLLRLLLGLEMPDCGTITGVPREKSAVFQENRLIPRLSALDNIRMAVPEAGELAQTLLEELGMDPKNGTPAAALSGGEARRAALARALAKKGELLALDEPFSGLDAQTRLLAAGTILRHLNGRTLLLITHRPEELTLLGIEQEFRLPGVFPAED